MSLKDRVVFITGASRGIGKCIALACAKQGATVVGAAKSLDSHPTLPGTLRETVAEIEALGQKAFPIQLDVRDAQACENAIETTVNEFGRVDVLVNNAGTLWWADVTDTPVKRFDLMMDVNVRASFVLSRAALPHMIKNKWGHIIMMSPPVIPEATAHHGAYAVSKFGMTMIASAVDAEYRSQNIAGHALWPATAIESLATIHFKLGTPQTWRKADILADAVLALVSKEPSQREGRAWIDEDLLREEGVTDFTPYRCDPEHEPPKLDFNSIPKVAGA